MIKRLIFPTLTGTTAMTLFSYLISRKKNENFKEPELLAEILQQAKIELSEKQSKAAGIASHYMVGLMFVAIYVYLWENAILKPGLLNGIGLGAASGLCGIAAWEITLKFCPMWPVKCKSRYFGHLFLAHIIFGLFATIGYRICGQK